jgi:hypothetical protein
MKAQGRFPATFMAYILFAILCVGFIIVLTIVPRGKSFVAEEAFDAPIASTILLGWTQQEISPDTPVIRELEQIALQYDRKLHGTLRADAESALKDLNANWTLILDAPGNPVEIASMTECTPGGSKIEQKTLAIQPIPLASRETAYLKLTKIYCGKRFILPGANTR